MNWGRRGAFLCRSPPTPERSDYEDYQGKAPCMTPEGYDLCNQGWKEHISRTWRRERGAGLREQVAPRL
jgi:hypothetical protein